MAKTHWLANPGKTACGREILFTGDCYTQRTSTNAAVVDCLTCRKLIPAATLTIWDRLLDEDVPTAPPPLQPRKRKPKQPEVVAMVGRRSGMSVAAAASVATRVNRTNGMTEAFRLAYGVETQRLEAEFAPYRIARMLVRSDRTYIVLGLVFVILEVLHLCLKK